MKTDKIWYVTGASKGLGLALVKKLLATGYKVAATSRNATTLSEAVGAGNSENFLPLEVDLVDEQSVAESIRRTQEVYGKIDVIVNNAGYGIGGTIEELSQEEISEAFNINVFGTINVIKYAMPYLRAQRSGYIINISSIAGFAPATGWSIYAAAKHAIIGLSESLADDVRQLGTKVTAIAPGAFRTQFLTKESLVFAENSIEDYEEVHASHDKFHKMNGNQLGDPEKAAEVMIHLAESDNPPVRLYLGSDAYRRASAKLGTLTQMLEDWKDTTLSTDFQE
ncbi:SDR family NAD(P)-dependent oxidoreductase [Flavobacterium lindanitolerans]|uniref:NADP-dependent 3-hydroxy acid dehydrogenase YdfG n=1 Tax=Flavobacterium lindanitolerans TaxID=428988 RepID=A0A497UV26_9FLAO|nr:SDR family NAD(P)-dependent oxidoreductase [Flavobacterium lindanitolerans]MBC8644528.1 SDR family NAD(P)-dependent oxidoreductase [Flavobacterium lindanitolerans]PKW20857.1 NADP-dependent 3-hydroxy acid dehydrogenase YdfG [Flavobacterium lindanitolerans]RLJ30504.1 NADP-dependent 3-hydroxy acid dehydrogenase YdfG [Flavobacterium lindanitolerans]